MVGLEVGAGGSAERLAGAALDGRGTDLAPAVDADQVGWARVVAGIAAEEGLGARAAAGYCGEASQNWQPPRGMRHRRRGTKKPGPGLNLQILDESSV
jgi:hypothetical protein